MLLRLRWTILTMLAVAAIPATAQNKANFTTGPDVIPDPTPQASIVYINENAPICEPLSFPGERYEALIPATLDPAERARLSVNYFTEVVNPNMEYQSYNMIELMADPPVMWHNMGDATMLGKYLEMMPITRLMSGCMDKIEVDHAYMQMFLKMQGEDGLPYTPTSGRRFLLERGGYLLPPEDQKDSVNHICTLGYGTARALSAFSIFIKMDPEGPWKEAARRLVEGIKKTIYVDGDDAYMFDHWMIPGREIAPPEESPMGIVAGGNAWTAQALIQYHRAVGDSEALALAGKLLHYIFFNSGYFNEDGQYREDQKGVAWAHFHTHAMGILAALYYVEETGDEALLDRALKAYRYGIVAGDGLVGFFPEAVHDTGPQFMGHVHGYGYHTSETCEVVDMIINAIKFSKLGIDKWDDADRWLRNQLAENQLTNVNWLTDGHVDYSKAVITDAHRDMFYRPDLYTNDRVAQRSIGGYSSHPTPNDFVGHPELIVSIANCCSGNGPRAFYHVWRDMISLDRGEMMWTFDRPILRVHLLFNRASRWADIDSHIPYKGLVEVKVKQNLKLEMRIPQWVEPDQAKATVDGEARALQFKGRYAQIGEVNGGQTVALKFPISERTATLNIQNRDYKVIVRGNSVVDIDPPGKYLPLYQRGHYRTGKTLYRKVDRFVPEDELNWW